MPLVPIVVLCLAQAPAPLPSVHLLKRVNELEKAKDWAGLADFCERLPPAERSGYLMSWLQGLERSGRWARLLEVCEDPALAPRIPNHFKGRALAELGRHAEARDWLLGFARKGDVLACLEGWNEATTVADLAGMLDCAQMLVAKFPANGTYLGMKGEALARQGRYPEAEPILVQATTLAPKRAMSWADLACCLNERTEYAQALESADRALALEPRLLEGLCNRGRALVGLTRYREARDDFAAALALGPKDPALAANLKQNLQAADKYLAWKAKPARPGKGGRP